MKIKSIILLFIILSSGCGILRPPEERAKRKIKKILEKYPDISSQEESSRIDTIVSLDSIFTKEVSIDTSFIFTSDTVFFVTEGRVSTEVQVIDRERLRIKTVVRSDTIYFRDTIFKQETIIREVLKPIEVSFFDKYGILLILSGMIIIGYLIYRFI